MAGLEIVVRPVVFPNIRPAPTRSLLPEDDPTKGFCTIKGSSGKVIDLSMSWNVSTSKSKPVETERRVDEVTIYQQNDDGTVNKKNFVKMQVANRIKMQVPIADVPIADVPIAPALGFPPRPQPANETYSYTPMPAMPQAPNIEIGQTNITIMRPK